MRSTSTLGFALLGAGLIAISYGLARFAFGLFVPPMRADLGPVNASRGHRGAACVVQGKARQASVAALRE